MVTYDLIIDNREQNRIEKAKEFFKGYEECKSVNVEQLPSSDYLFRGDNGVTVGFEYKTAKDFLSSIQDHRVFNECIAMREDYDYCFLVIEHNLKYAFREFHFKAKIDFSTKQVKGAYRRIRTILPIILVDNPYKKNKATVDNSLYKYCFEEMHEQVLKCLDGKTPYYTEIKCKKHKNPAMTLLLSLRSINYKTAKNIVDTLNLKTQEDYFNITKDDLVKVDGVGDKKATNILRQRGGAF